MFDNPMVFYVENKRKIHEAFNERMYRYPSGFRHYENYNNYSYVKKDATIEEYMSEMNRQIRFDEFLAIVTQHLREEMRTPEGKMHMKRALERRYGQVDEDFSDDMDELDPLKRDHISENDQFSDPAFEKIVNDLDSFVKTDHFVKEARSYYAARVQGFLLEKKIYSLVECLEETLDFSPMAWDMKEIHPANTYIPVMNTIMKKPDLNRNGDEDFGFRFNEYEKERHKTIQKFGPLDQLSPLRGHRMAPGLPTL
jgi:hypothetical protein